MNTIILKSGTGMMQSLSEVITELQKQGYRENLTLRYDHFSCRSDMIDLYPEDFFVDDIFRFENTSDPDDQAALYAVSVPLLGIKGIYVESYGIYHEEMASSMIERIKYCRKQTLQTKASKSA